MRGDHILMKALSALASVMLLVAGWPQVTQAAPLPTKDWTVLIFMNGKNNLEPDAMKNFAQLAKVGSDSHVNFVVQLGRPVTRPPGLQYMAKQFGGWSGAKRFYITGGQTPESKFAVESVGNDSDVDMGAPATLLDFLKWGKANYPARRYAVVIWNHGQGYRLLLQQKDAAPSPPPAFSPNRDPTNTHRAVSEDSDTHSIIYNSELAATLRQAFGPELKLVGFDACLMGMIETAYELRPVVPVMVGSEELEPGPGWDYSLVAKALTTAPTSDEVAVSKMIVDGYRATYGNGDETTMSAVRLSGAAPLATELSKLSDLLVADRGTLFPLVKAARDAVSAYNDPRDPVTIDLIGFLDQLSVQLQAKAQSSPALAQARRTRDLAKAMVISDYASSQRQGTFGSFGLAIYFPATKSDFDGDGWSDGYLRSNTYKPISFVTSEHWSVFLAAYLGLPA